MVNRGANKLAYETNSSHAASMISKKQNPNSNSQIGDDEFILSNSELLTDDDILSRQNNVNRTPTHITNQKINQ